MRRLLSEIHPRKLHRLDPVRLCFLLSLGFCIFIELGLNLIFLPTTDHFSFLNYSYLFEIIELLLLIAIFWAVQFAPLHEQAHRVLSCGLFVWILASAEDVSDELIIQPLWLAIWGEDSLRVIGMFLCTIGILFTIRQVTTSHAQVKQLAMMDELTQLPNRRSFRQNLHSYEHNVISVMLIDLDHFKQINDTYGHEKGDEVLSDFGRELSNLTQHSHNSFSARLGGEEFAVFINDDNKQSAAVFAEQILNRTRKIFISDQEEYLTASIGIAHKSSNESTHQALKRADIALYQAKTNGRNRFEWASS
jgi:diguanylate cyclase (GGDEF)-like protein